MNKIFIIMCCIATFIFLNSCAEQYTPFRVEELDSALLTKKSDDILIIPHKDFFLFPENSKIVKRSKRKNIQFIPVDIVNLKNSDIVFNYNRIDVLADLELVPVLDIEDAIQKVDRRLSGSITPFVLGLVGGLVVTSSGIQDYRFGPTHGVSLLSIYYFIKDLKINKHLEQEFKGYIFNDNVIQSGQGKTTIVAVKSLSSDLWFRYNDEE